MSDANTFLQTFHKEAANRTAATAFERFLDEQINIGAGTRSRASTSQNHLREFLIGEHDRDAKFPRILQTNDADFLGGSFARHSKIWPLDDIDVYFPIDGQDLVYRRGSLRLPYSALSDHVDLFNPLLNAGDRWVNGPYVSSKKLIDGFAKVLSRHYPAETRVRRAGEAVNVKLTDLGFDVVPCFSLSPDSPGDAHIYLIPDGHDGWIQTNPRIDIGVSDELQSRNGKTFGRAVKLVKWWNEQRFASRFESYYVELAIMRGFAAKNQWGEFLSSVSDAVALGFESLRDAAGAGDQAPWLHSSPPVERGPISTDELQVLDTVATAAREAVNAEHRGLSDQSLKVWGLIFGESFPGGRE
jgi:hypothetical protein